MLARLTAAACLTAAPAASAQDAPPPVRTAEHRFTAVAGGDNWQLGDLEQTRTTFFDELGRPLRWEERDADGELIITWIGLYLGDGMAPDRAAYWNADELASYPELFVSSPDGTFYDVLYADINEKPRRQMRVYIDEAGRNLYQEYFGPRSQQRYSEEIYRYDDRGNELGRTWQRLDGTASKDTAFDILEANEHGHWTRRLVTINGDVEAIDVRDIEYGSVILPHPPAAAGPVDATDEILPIPFAPGVISARATGENVLTFTPDGLTVLFTRYEDDWATQTGYTSRWREGAWREPEAVPFAKTMYNAALSADGDTIIYCERNTSLLGQRVFTTSRTADGWAEPVNLTSGFGFRGSYFRLLADGTLYFHRDGDLYRTALSPEGVGPGLSLGAPVNTPFGVEFGPWIDTDRQRLLFTRDNDDDPVQRGVFVSFREGDRWGEPAKLPIPYGWGVTISPDGEDLVYVVDDDICRVPTVLLADWLEPQDAERE